MALLDLLLDELAAGLPHLQGAAITAELPVRQEVLDRLLVMTPGLPRDLRVEIGPDRQLLVRVGPFHANARLAPALTLSPSPRLTVELASQLVAWGLRAVSLPPFVELAGRLVHVHLAMVPALRSLAPLWPHLTEVGFASAPGRLDVRVAVRVR
jgi:hypothetical protein